MFGSVFPSASCEAALRICPSNDGCDAITTGCKVAENIHFTAQANLVVRNRRFEWMRLDVYPTPQSSSDSLFNALHGHFCNAFHAVEADDGFAHWNAGADTSRYEVTLVEQRDEYQNTYLAVSYFPRGR